MSFQIAGHQTEHYRVNTPLYEGPLDLLLELIERAELDITVFALAQVTDQYLEYLRGLQERDAAEVSAFLIIAARLIQIKSAALLPRPSIDAPSEPEEDPGVALARQLLIYKRFKELAGVIHDRETRNLRTYLRIAPPAIKFEPKLDLTGITLRDLVQAGRAILLAQPDLPGLSRVVAMPRITIREKIRSIIDNLRRFGETNFRSLIDGRGDRVELIVTFLAMLELIKRRVVDAAQSDLFGDIHIQPTGQLTDEEVDVEFLE